MTHTDYPMRHYDRTCPECQKPEVPEEVCLRTVMPNDYRYEKVYGNTASQMQAYGQAMAEWGRAQALEEVIYSAEPWAELRARIVAEIGGKM